MSSYITTNPVYKVISDNIKARYNISLFKIELFPDGSGAVWSLDRMYNEVTEVFEFHDVDKLIEEFIKL